MASVVLPASEACRELEAFSDSLSRNPDETFYIDTAKKIQNFLSDNASILLGSTWPEKHNLQNSLETLESTLIKCRVMMIASLMIEIPISEIQKNLQKNTTPPNDIQLAIWYAKDNCPNEYLTDLLQFRNKVDLNNNNFNEKYLALHTMETPIGACIMELQRIKNQISPQPLTLCICQIL